jgi:FkbM family methyltransferase
MPKVNLQTRNSGINAEHVERHPWTKIQGVNGQFCLPEIGDSVVYAIRYGNYFEGSVVEFVKRHARPGTTVIDVGANFGQMTVEWSKAVGETGEVHSIEASDYVVYYLQKTMALNDHCKNVTVYHNSCWETSGEKIRMLASGGQYSGMGVLAHEGDPREGNSLWFESTTIAIDDLNYLLTKPVSVIKIDVQGADLFALRGARKTLLRDRPIVIFEYEEMYDPIHGITFKDYIDFLDEVNYVIVCSLDNNQHDFICKPKEMETKVE